MRVDGGASPLDQVLGGLVLRALVAVIHFGLLLLGHGVGVEDLSVGEEADRVLAGVVLGALLEATVLFVFQFNVLVSGFCQTRKP